MAQSIFERIARREADAHIVFESTRTMAILDIAPAREGHTILFPKEPYQILAQMPDETLVDLFLALRVIRHATILQDETVHGLTSLIAQGPIAGQKVPHLIIHTIPRRTDDGLFTNDQASADPETASRLAGLFERSDGLIVEASDPAWAAGDVRVIDPSVAVFEELDPSRIGIFASAIREASVALFERFEAQGTNILIESGFVQPRAGALARIVPRVEGDGLSFEWDADSGADLRSINERFTRSIEQVTRRPSEKRVLKTNYLLKQLERLP